MRTLRTLHRKATTRAIKAGLVATTLMAATAGTAFGLPGEPEDEPGPTDLPPACQDVSGTLSASLSTVASGAPTTLTWHVNEPAGCDGELSYKFGTSSASSSYVGTDGAAVRNPVIGTTYRLIADFGGHYRTLASRYIAIEGEIPVTVSVDHFSAQDVQEVGMLSNGDEPYLMVFPIFADGRSVDASNLPNAQVRVLSPARAHDNLNRAGVKHYDSFAVPTDTGRFSTVVQPVRGLSMSMGKRMATVGLAVIALEEDATPDSAAMAGMQAARAEIQDQVTTLVRTATVPDAQAIQDMQDAVEDAVTWAVTKETLASFGLFGFVDPDDFIGAKFIRTSQTAIETAGAAGIPVNMTLTGDGATYTVHGSIRQG